MEKEVFQSLSLPAVNRAQGEHHRKLSYPYQQLSPYQTLYITGSEWYRLYAKHEDTNGVQLRLALVALLEQFPKYELDHERSFEATAIDIVERLEKVTAYPSDKS